MKFSVRIKEVNQAGETVRDKTLMKTATFSRALSAFHQHADSVRGLGNGRSKLLLIDGEKVRRKNEF